MGVIKAVPGICKKQILCYNGVRIQHIMAASRFLVSNNPLLKRHGLFVIIKKQAQEV